MSPQQLYEQIKLPTKTHPAAKSIRLNSTPRQLHEATTVLLLGSVLGGAYCATIWDRMSVFSFNLVLLTGWLPVRNAESSCWCFSPPMSATAWAPEACSWFTCWTLTLEEPIGAVGAGMCCWGCWGAVTRGWISIFDGGWGNSPWDSMRRDWRLMM